MVNRPCMFCISCFIHLDGICEKPCAELRESNSNNVFQPKIILFFLSVKNNEIIDYYICVDKVSEKISLSHFDYTN